jgi:acetoacetate decarboxylase
MRGFSTPLTASGRSSIAPTPPWFFAGRFVAVEFWAAAEAVRTLLPEGVEADNPDDPRCTIVFYEWQWVSERADEYLDPIQSQFREVAVLVDARIEGRPMSYVPFMYVDSDLSLARGWIQGLPKKLGAIRLTRPYPPISSPAAPKVAPGERFAASLAAGDRRLADAQVKLEGPQTGGDGFWERPLLCRRHFPNLDGGMFEQPTVDELIELLPVEAWMPEVQDVWTGAGELSLFPSAFDEVADLAPVRCGRGWHGYRTLSLSGSRLLRKYR